MGPWRCDCFLPDRSTFPDEHELVAVRVHAHGEVGCFAVLFLGLAGEGATCGDNFGSAGHHIGDLEAEAGPGSFSFAAAVDAEGGTRDQQLGNVGIATGDFRTEAGLIEGRRPRQICRPDDVFDTFDVHGEIRIGRVRRP